MKSNSIKANKNKIINDYVSLRNAAFEEVAIDMTQQTICILLGALMIEGSYTDDELRDMYETFVHFINTETIMGRQVCSDEITDTVVKRLGIDIQRIKPRIGK